MLSTVQLQTSMRVNSCMRTRAHIDLAIAQLVDDEFEHSIPSFFGSASALQCFVRGRQVLAE